MTKSLNVLGIMTLVFATAVKADVVPFQWGIGSFQWTGNHNGLSFATAPAGSGSTNSAGNLNIPLGTFTLASNGYTGNPGGSFSITMNFARPNLITAGGNQTFSATYDGYFSFLAGEVMSIDFNNTPTAFNFNGSDGVGSFSFAIDDVTVNTGGLLFGSDLSEALMGRVTNATLTSDGANGAAPEPQSVLLLVTAIAGAGFMARRKIRA